MNIFLNYNFCGDGNALDPFIADFNDSIKSVELNNGIYNHFNVTSDVTSEYSTTIPTSWTDTTIMDCDFNGNINAGSLQNIVSGVTSIRIKRREYGTYNWMAVKEIPVVTSDDFQFAFEDYFAKNDTRYEYAFVPMIGTTEGNYSIAEVWSKFNGVFLCDTNTAFKYMSGVEYGTNTTMQKIGIFEPFGKQYPIVIANALTSYDSGSINGDVLPPSYYLSNNRQIDRQAIVAERELLKRFLTNKKPKILKDTNGNIWLLIITGSPSTSYNNGYGMGVIKMGATWTEIGNAESNVDMYNAGLIPTAE